MNGFTPRPGAAGQRPSRGQVAGLTQAMVSQRIIESPDIIPVAGAGGTALRLRRPLVATPAASPGLPPLHVVSRTTVADGWRMGVTPGVLYTANANFTPRVPHLTGTALDAATAPTAVVTADQMNVYLHIELDEDERVLPPPTIELVDAEDDQPVDDFWHGYLRIATITRGGDEDAPSLAVNQLLSGQRVHRKVNLTHLWGRM